MVTVNWEGATHWSGSILYICNSEVLYLLVFRWLLFTSGNKMLVLKLIVYQTNKQGYAWKTCLNCSKTITKHLQVTSDNMFILIMPTSFNWGFHRLQLQPQRLACISLRSPCLWHMTLATVGLLASVLRRSTRVLKIKYGEVAHRYNHYKIDK